MLSVQPRLADGRRLDDIAGSRFFLAVQRELLDELPADLAARLTASEEITVLSDLELTGELLASVHAGAVCVRPDRYIMGVADSADALAKLLTRVPFLIPAVRDRGLNFKGLTMSFSPITHLRHVDLAVPDYNIQVAFYKDHWGLTPVGSDSGVTYFAAEGSPEQYIVRVRNAQDKRIDLVSFGAADRTAVDGLAQRLGNTGVTLVSEPGDLQTPGGGYGFRFFDLEGRTIEVSAGVAVRAHRKIEVREDIPVRISHVVLNSPEPEKMLAWYSEHLGFRLSDTLNHPRVGDVFYFLRCSPQHHSMAIARGPHPSLQHVSFELRGIDEYMFGTGRLIRAGFEKIWGPGVTGPGTTPSPISSTPAGTRWSTPPNSRSSTRTAGTRTSTVPTSRKPRTSGARPTR